ncbi:hypothetical protein HQ520_01285, partial [bacterium]|nr:hypothetical protein [bacterium]
TLHLGQEQDFYFIAGNVAPAEKRLSTGGERQRVLSTGAASPASDSQAIPHPLYISQAGTWQTVSLILDNERQPLGIGTVPLVHLDEDPLPVWKGLSLEADHILRLEELESIQTRLRQRFTQHIAEIRIAFRQKGSDSGSMWGSFGSGSDLVPTEKYYYGIPIRSDLIFVPARISRDQAKVINTIGIRSGEQDLNGEFAGAYDDIGAFVIRVEQGGLIPADSLFLDGSLPAVKPVHAIHPRRRFGRKDIDVRYDRSLRVNYGYKDVLEPIPASERRVGTWFTDRDGALYAVLLEQRPEGEEKERFRNGDSPGLYSAEKEFRRVFSMTELRDYFENPDEHLDPTIVWLPEEKEQRKMWLGIEYENMSPELSKAFHVEKPSKDGKIGLVVSLVYPDSPAGKIGLQPGCILLSVQEEDEKEPVELKGNGRDFGFNFDNMGLGNVGGFSFANLDRPPWPDRKNSLTDLLEVLGQGKSLALRYLDVDYTGKTSQFRIEQSPPDFDSAQKHKDDSLGLTVKNITYEVRYILQLDASEEGIVVADIEDGSPAAVARVARYQLIRRIDDEPVPDVSAYREIIEKARQRVESEGSVTLRLTLQQLGQTHFADVTLE